MTYNILLRTLHFEYYYVVLASAAHILNITMWPLWKWPPQDVLLLLFVVVISLVYAISELILQSLCSLLCVATEISAPLT